MDSQATGQVGTPDSWGVKRLPAPVTERKPTYYGHILRKKWDYLEKGIIKGTTPGTQDRPKTTRNVKTVFLTKPVVVL